jgi:hypothetical protein
MSRRCWGALVPLLIASCASWGCGDSADSGQVQRSEATLKADANSQEAMRAYMQTKKGSSRKGSSKKAAARTGQPPTNGAPAGEAD